MISLADLNCLHCGHLILRRWRREIVAKSKPRIIPKNRVIKIVASISLKIGGFFLLPITPLFQFVIQTILASDDGFYLFHFGE